MGGGANMADEAGEVNTLVRDGEAGEQRDELQVSKAETDAEFGGSDGPERTERSSPATENSWSAPLLSLARKATETISSGVSYAGGLRNPSVGSTASSPTEMEPENNLNNTSKKLPGTLCLFVTAHLPFNVSSVTYCQPQSASHDFLLDCLSAVVTHDLWGETEI